MGCNPGIVKAERNIDESMMKKAPCAIPDKQLSINFGYDKDSLRSHFQDNLGRPATLVLTDNSTNMLSVRTINGVAQIRLHRMFLYSGEPVIAEIVSFLKNRKASMPHFRSFIRTNREHITKKHPKRVSVITAGKYHDLQDIFDEINLEYFGGMIKSRITWGTKSARYFVRKRTLGSYSRNSNMIRINPVLDKKNVPRYFLAFVIYHEMLHESVGETEKGCRRIIHSAQFKNKERLFKDYEKATAWETTNLR
ncbi:MAG: hypothetical protein HQL10_07010 [Nitrospirae bacterium]|nr:hypothetical protein [Nitrospirota bacterium]